LSVCLEVCLKMSTLFELQISGGENLKSFSSALSFLRAVGKELQIEVTVDSLVLRALNDAKTAYASVELSRMFFPPGSFTLHTQSLSDAFGRPAATQGESFSCKLPIKYLCALTKSFRNASKLMLRAESSANGGFELVLVLQSHSSITRTHRFKYSDCDVVSAVFDEEGSCSLRAMNKLLVQLLEHMHGAHEVTVSATPTSFKVQSHYRAAPQALGEAGKHLTTGLSFSVEDFDFYDFNLSGEGGGSQHLPPLSCTPTGEPLREVIVSKREWRALLQFSDNIGCEDVSINFLSHGMPIKLAVQHEAVQATLIMTSITQAAPSVQATAAAAAGGAVANGAGSTQPEAHVPGTQPLSSQPSSQMPGAGHRRSAQAPPPASGSSSSSGGRKAGRGAQQERTDPPNSSSRGHDRSSPSRDPRREGRFPASVRRGRAEAEAEADTDSTGETQSRHEGEDPDDTQRLMSSEARDQGKGKGKAAAPAARRVIAMSESESSDDDVPQKQRQQQQQQYSPGPSAKKRKLRRLSKTGDAVKALLRITGDGDQPQDQSQSQPLVASSAEVGPEPVGNGSARKASKWDTQSDTD
jgi:hypothetical protein